MLDFLSLRAIAGLERVSSRRYERTIAVGGVPGAIRVGMSDGESALRLEMEGADEAGPVVERARRLFDLEADPKAICRVLAKEPLLAESVERHPGLRVPGCWDGFELAVRAILGQQVTVRGAATLAARLVRSYGERIAEGDESELTHLFPTAAVLRDAELGEVGLPGRRAETIRTLAAEVSAGRLSLESGVDLESFVSAMTAIPGVGEWTAQYVAMRALRHADAFPASDLVLLKAASGGAGRSTPKELSLRAEAWRPWRAYAALHLWKASA